MDSKSNLDLAKSFKHFAESIDNVNTAYSKLFGEIRELNYKNVPIDFLEEMAGNLAHEIRNPLGGISNFVSLISKETATKSVNGIHAGVDRINKVVDDLIVFSKSVTPYFVCVNFPDFIKRAIEVFKNDLGQYAKYNFSLELPTEDLFLKIDPELMQKVLINVLQNSVEKMTGGGEIEIRLNVEAKPNQAILSIADQGCGLPDGDVEKPFYPFFTTKTNGMGLGLSTARLIIEKHGGSIKLKDTADHGAIVEITLPLNSDN